MKRQFTALALLAVLVSSFAGIAYGHGLGNDVGVPIRIGDRQVTVTGIISPASVPIDPSTTPSLLVRAYDANRNDTIRNINYNLVVEIRNETLLEQRFKSSDGIIMASLIPDENVQQWQITGQESSAPGDPIEVSQASPVEIRSKILASGGLYHLIVTLEKSSPGLVLQNDINFDLYISVAHSHNFTADTPDGERDLVVRTYYDNVDELNYQNGTISFSMPFDWDLDYVSQVPFLHMEVRFPRTIEALQTNSYNGSLNGVSLPTTSIQIDDYSSEQNRIVHFVIPNDRLGKIAGALDEGTISAVFNLTGTKQPRFPLDFLSAPGEKYLLQLSWGPEVIETGIPTTFVINVRDPVTEDVIRNPSFDFVMTQAGTEIYRERLQEDFGGFAKNYTFSQPGTVTFSAANINGEGEAVRLDLVVLQGPSNPPLQIPPQQPSGCLIATAAFGSELSPQVQYLRNFRENYILSTSSGSAFMNTFNSVYYSFSPQVADYEREQPWLLAAVKVGLYPLFGILTLSERAHFGVGGGDAGVILAGLVASSLIGATYLVPAGLAVTRKFDARWIAMSMGAAGAFMIITIIALPAFLPLSTAALVTVFAGSTALLVAKPLLRLIRKD
ncbi:MAG: CFI-box-CTERM domain-containing protein [Nitrososphaera sp.]